MVNLLRIMACSMILFSLNTSLSSAEPISSTDEVSWDKFYRLQPSDMEGYPESRLYQWAILTNIIEGYPDNTLKPDQPVTEAEFLKMLYRGFGIALPTQTWPEGYYASYDWTDAPYRMAKVYNHPTVGLSSAKLRSAPITRIHAAEIISAAQGVHYDGNNAVTYIVGNLMAINSPLTIDDFQPNRTVTRTEAVQWIRHLTLRGMMEIKSRPIDPTDPSLLPDLPLTSAEAVPPFSAVPLTDRDLDLLGTQTFPKVEFGASKSAVDQSFGVPEQQLDIFNKDVYPLFSAHYNEDGFLDAWRIDQFGSEPSTNSSGLRTNKGIVLGESTLFDVLQQYGTFGYSGDQTATYMYEKTTDGGFRPLTSVSYYPQLENPEDVYLLSFIFDKDTLKVSYILAAWAPYAYDI